MSNEIKSVSDKGINFLATERQQDAAECFHIAAAYQNKDGKQFQGKVGIVNGKQYYEGTALIPLFK